MYPRSTFTHRPWRVVEITPLVEIKPTAGATGFSTTTEALEGSFLAMFLVVVDLCYSVGNDRLGNSIHRGEIMVQVDHAMMAETGLLLKRKRIISVDG